MNPTNNIFERRIAAVEGGRSALAVASGQAATTYSLLNLSLPGDEIIICRQPVRWNLPAFQLHFL